jgi:hypothetical protein
MGDWNEGRRLLLESLKPGLSGCFLCKSKAVVEINGFTSFFKKRL